MNPQSGVAAAQDEKALTSLVQGVKLPPQPRIVVAIGDELKLTEPNFGKIAELASKDAALAAKILKVINSPYYGVSREVKTISQALALLGLRNFQNVIITSALKESLGGDDQVTEALWDHSLLVAFLGRAVAQKTHGVDPEAAYLAGLFHDAAIPILLKKFSGYLEVIEMDVARGGNIVGFEQDKFKTDHSIAGYLLARSWGLVDEVLEAIHFHHADNLTGFSCSPARALGAVIMLADQIARETTEDYNPESADTIWEIMRPQVMAELQLDENDVVDLRESAAELSGMV